MTVDGAAQCHLGNREDWRSVQSLGTKRINDCVSRDLSILVMIEVFKSRFCVCACKHHTPISETGISPYTFEKTWCCHLEYSERKWDTAACIHPILVSASCQLPANTWSGMHTTARLIWLNLLFSCLITGLVTAVLPALHFSEQTN